jgi:ribosomal 30S subunit maturation factor RimM
LLSVTTSRGEKLIPMVSEFVVGVDRKTRTITVNLPEGMLD